MRIVIDTDAQELNTNDRKVGLYSDEAFKVISDIWVKVGWNQKYTYSFSWLGVPIIQLPEDLMRYQEAVFNLKPDLIIETGVAHGGSAVLAASLCQLIGNGRVIAIDIEIRPHNRERIEAHPLAKLITLIEGSSTASNVVAEVQAEIDKDATVMVMLDSNHSYAHVMRELELYAPMVSKGSWIVASDGVMRDLTDTPRGQPSWNEDNPANAAQDFVAANPNFKIEETGRPFNESTLDFNITHWPDAWIRRIA